MASSAEMRALGYEDVRPQKSAAEQVFGFLNGMDQTAQKQQEKDKADVMDQAKLYTTLREQGYSKEAAHERVTRTYRSTNFIEGLLNGEKNAFTPPTETDKVEQDRQKAEADLAKTKADTGLIGAKQGYYESGGPKRTVIDTMTPNQLQQRLTYLTKAQTMADPGSEEEQTAKAEIDVINQKLQKLAGYQAPGQQEDPPGTVRPNKPLGKAPAKQWKVGDMVKHHGQVKQIKRIDSAGKLYF